MATQHGTLVRNSVASGRGLRTGGIRRHSVAVAMLLLLGVQGSALVSSDGSPATQASPAVAPAASSTVISQDAGLMGVLATEAACGALLLVALRRSAQERKQRVRG